MPATSRRSYALRYATESPSLPCLQITSHAANQSFLFRKVKKLTRNDDRAGFTRGQNRLSRAEKVGQYRSSGPHHQHSPLFCPWFLSRLSPYNYEHIRTLYCSPMSGCPTTLAHVQ